MATSPISSAVSASNFIYFSLSQPNTMKLSKELYNAGVLGHQNTRPTDWVLEDRRARRAAYDPFTGTVTHRQQQSIKVSPRGLRVLADVLRFH